MTKTIVITGASAGLGAAAARAMSGLGWHVAVVGRNAARTAAVAADIGGTPFIADFDRLDDVRRLATQLLDRYDSIDVLANNAGGLVPRRRRSADGFERTIQHNHLAPFLLTNLLIDRLVASRARVIGTSSVAHRWGRLRPADLDRDHRPYLGGWGSYATAKLATNLFARELGERTGLESYSFHPGFVRSNFGSDSPGVMAFVALAANTQISPESGAAPLVHLATTRDTGVPNGTYFDRLAPVAKVRKAARDPELAALLWSESATRTGLAASATRRADPAAEHVP